MPQIIGSGGALLDYDGDGDLDFYLINSGSGRGDDPEATNQLYRQEEDGSFREVAGSAGLNDRGYGMGCAVGDFDNDGDPDIVVTKYGANRIFENLGNGQFADITPGSGIDGERWSTSAVFLDYDRDGFLDLYIANYLQYDPTRQCHDSAGRREYCGPEAFLGERDRLYRNQGDGSFEDVSAAAGISRVAGKGLGVLSSDLNGDGWIDIYVANDGEANQLWINQQDGTFQDEAMIRGAAFNMSGRPEASMGVAIGDIDGDEDMDLFMTHLDRESNTLYLNSGQGDFEDRTAGAGLSTPSLPYTGFGTVFFDFDLDGDLDLFVGNGRVRRGAVSVGATNAMSGTAQISWEDYAEANLLFENEAGRFTDISHRAGRLTSLLEVSRAVMAGDLDGDGNLELILTSGNGPARLFTRNSNAGAPQGRWLQVSAIDPSLNRDAIGARVTVLAKGRRIVREISTNSGYLAAVPPVAHFGLGNTETVDAIEVRWPDGTSESFPGTSANQLLVLKKGDGS